MKNKFTLFSLLLASQLSAQNIWVEISSPGMTPVNLTDVYAKGSKIICIGDNPGAGLYSAESISEDDGQTWQTLSFPNIFTKTIAFSDNNTGFIGGYAYLGGQFLSGTRKTTNGGATWGPIVTHSLEGLESITFRDAMNGYAGGYNSFLYTGAFFRTSDGGTTWNVVYTNTTDAFEDVWMAPDDLTGYATDCYPSLFKTTDGGISWNKITNVPGSVTGLHFWDANKGVICTIGGKIYKTVNGGTTWVSTTNGGNTHPLADVEFMDATFGFAVGDQGTVMQSVDGGDHWTRATLQGSPSLTGIRFYESKAYAMGDAGKLYQYEINTVSLPEYSQSREITCYPNPAKNLVTVTTGDIKAVSVSIYNSLGEAVLTREVNDNQATVDVSSLKPALYFVYVKDEAGRNFMNKLIKE